MERVFEDEEEWVLDGGVQGECAMECPGRVLGNVQGGCSRKYGVWVGEKGCEGVCVGGGDQRVSVHLRIPTPRLTYGSVQAWPSLQ